MSTVKVTKFTYRTVYTNTEKGLKEAERLSAAGWKMIHVGLFMIQFERRQTKEKKRFCK